MFDTVKFKKLFNLHFNSRAILNYCENKFVKEYTIQISDLLRNLPFGSTQDYFSYSDKSQVPKHFNNYILNTLDIKAHGVST